MTNYFVVCRSPWLLFSILSNPVGSTFEYWNRTTHPKVYINPAFINIKYQIKFILCFNVFIQHFKLLYVIHGQNTPIWHQVKAGLTIFLNTRVYFNKRSIWQSYKCLVVCPRPCMARPKHLVIVPFSHAAAQGSYFVKADALSGNFNWEIQALVIFLLIKLENCWCGLYVTNTTTII